MGIVYTCTFLSRIDFWSERSFPVSRRQAVHAAICSGKTSRDNATTWKAHKQASFQIHFPPLSAFTSLAKSILFSIPLSTLYNCPHFRQLFMIQRHWLPFHGMCLSIITCSFCVLKNLGVKEEGQGSCDSRFTTGSSGIHVGYVLNNPFLHLKGCCRLSSLRTTFSPISWSPHPTACAHISSISSERCIQTNTCLLTTHSGFAASHRRTRRTCSLSFLPTTCNIISAFGRNNILRFWLVLLLGNISRCCLQKSDIAELSKGVIAELSKCYCRAVNQNITVKRSRP